MWKHCSGSVLPKDDSMQGKPETQTINFRDQRQDFS